MKSFVISILFVAFSASLIAQEQGIPYTLADRDRLIKVEEQMSSLNQRMDDMNNRIDDMNNRIDRLEDKFDSYFTWGFGLVLGAIFMLMGFVIWDRRTTLAPVQQQQQKMLEVLKEFGKDNPKLLEAMKNAALY